MEVRDRHFSLRKKEQTPGRNKGDSMKFAFILLIFLLSVSAFTANNKNVSSQKTNMKTTEKISPTPKPANNEVTQLDDLVRGEEAAIKAYGQPLKGDSLSAELKEQISTKFRPNQHVT